MSYESNNRAERNLSDPRTSTVDSKGVPYGVRLMQIRESKGESVEQIAAKAGITSQRYYDLEEGEGEVNMAISLGEISRVAAVLGVPTWQVFDDEPLREKSVSLGELVEKLKAHLETTGLTISEFEDRVGFALSKSIFDPSEIQKWNVDCLRSVCKEIEIDWRVALP